MRSFASRTFFGVSRLAAPRWSSAPHSDGHHLEPIGVSGSFSGSGFWPPAKSQRLTPVRRMSKPRMYGVQRMMDLLERGLTVLHPGVSGMHRFSPLFCVFQGLSWSVLTFQTYGVPGLALRRAIHHPPAPWCKIRPGGVSVHNPLIYLDFRPFCPLRMLKPLLRDF